MQSNNSDYEYQKAAILIQSVVRAMVYRNLFKSEQTLRNTVLADMYMMEGLKYSCMVALERGLCAENVSEILEDVGEMNCPCDELKRICQECLARHVED